MDPSREQSVVEVTIVIIDNDANQTHAYYGVYAAKLREICDEHSMNFDKVTSFIDEQVELLGSSTFMFQLPLFNQHHPKEN